MKYRVDVDRDAEKEMARLPTRSVDRLKTAIRTLADNPRPRGCRKLSGNIFRIRVGDYRVIYVVNDRLRELNVISVANRKDAYR